MYFLVPVSQGRATLESRLSYASYRMVEQDILELVAPPEGVVTDSRYFIILSVDIHLCRNRHGIGEVSVSLDDYGLSVLDGIRQSIHRCRLR